ncbi:MAG TPA: MiaB/RimO family radical SAM methylthiotransferase [Ktedonobacterales bacterium]
MSQTASSIAERVQIAKGKYHIWTVGCQMNMADSQRVSSILDGLGWEEVPAMDQANLVVLNTCSVREQPEKRAHGQLSLLRHAKRSRADLLVAMMGCMVGSSRQLVELKAKYPVVDLFFKVEQADILPRFLEERWTPLAGEGCIDFADLGAPRTIGVSGALPVLPMPTPPFPPRRGEGPEVGLPEGPEPIPVSRPHEAGAGAMAVEFRPGSRELHYPTADAVQFKTRGPTAWLPVILGCNKVCSYCIVPSRRGRERSRPMEELLVEARELVDGGARELTLLGQTVEAYGLDLPERADLGDLMERLSTIDDLERIRFMTSYPRHMTDKMIHQMAALPKVCEHVNIPVQHGDDDMLAKMRRGYTLGEYRALIAKLRAWWPGVALSTDIIVGFCGETEEQFQHSLDLLEEIRFDIVHVAAYSPRPGTLSFKWEDDVPLEEKKRRLHAVEQVQERIAREINAAYVGRTEEVLIEAHQVVGQVSGGAHQWRGRDRANKLVFCPAERAGSSSGGAGKNPYAAASDGTAVAIEERTQRDRRRDDQAAVRPGSLVHIEIERATAWSLQGRLVTR